MKQFHFGECSNFMENSLVHYGKVSSSYFFYSVLFSRGIPIFPIFEQFLIKFPISSYFPRYCCRTRYAKMCKFEKNGANLLFSLDFGKKTAADVRK